MSSAGQVIGGIVGGVIGFFAGGNVALGASIGMSIGGYIDPPKGPKGRPPSASDLAVQTATYGAALGDGDGTYGTLGNIFWVEGNTLRAEEHKAEGGKGGGSSGPSTYDIFGTFAVGFGEGEIAGYGRLWFGSKLIADYTSSDVGAIMGTALHGVLGGKDSGALIGTSASGGTISFYLGAADQLPDDRIQADMGAANTPAYRGLHYIVVKDWPMADFGNSLMGMQIKAEIIHDANIDQYRQNLYIASGLFSPFAVEFSDFGPGKGPYNPSARNGLFTFNKEQYTYCLSMNGDLVYRHSDGAIPGSPGDPGERCFVGTLSNGSAVWFDVTIGSGGGVLKIAGSTFASRLGSSTDAFCGACVGGDGRLYVLMSTGGVGRFEIYDSSLTLVSSQPQSILTEHSTTSYPAVPGAQGTFCVENNGAFFWYAQSTGGSTTLDLYGISSTGELSFLWNYNTGFYGPYGLYACMAAENGICYHTTDGGSFAVFSRNPVVDSQLVPLADVIRRRSLKSGLLESSDIDVSEITASLRGYRVANIGTIRSSLEPLQAAWPFDVIPHGYQIKFVPRAQSSVATIDISELGCVSRNEKPGVRITTSREMDSQLPRKVIVTYLDVSREYDINTGPGSERLNTDAVNIEQIELPIVMSATEAAQAEEVLLYLRWLERHDISFVLPPIYLNLEPADVITINGDAATYEVRLTQINYLPDGRMECFAKFNNVAVYTSVAVAQESASPVQVLTFAGPSHMSLMDIPVVDSTVMDKPGVLSAAAGYFSGWPGATLCRSDDSGQSWTGIQGFIPPGCAIGESINSIASVPNHVIDTKSLLIVRMISGALSSVSLSAMLNGENHFAYGASGRWEIIAAKNCVQQSDETWYLTDFMRGRFGTERYMGTHAADDSIILLDRAKVRFISLDVSTINLSRLWRPVTIGASIDSAIESSFTYSGVNLKPLSPVYLNGSRHPTTLEWALSWTRRSRTGVEAFSGVATPIGESSESYEVEIWDSSYSTLKRTITGLSSASATYSQADQVSDFGIEQSTIYVRVYQLSSVIGRGYSLEASIYRYIIIDLYIDSVVLLLHMNDTGLSDSGPHTHTVSLNGSVARSATQSKFGGYSASFNGTNSYLSIADNADWYYATSNITIEFFYLFTSAPGTDQYFFAQRQDGSNYVFSYATSTTIVFDSYTTGGGQGPKVTATGVTHDTTQWHHLAIVRESNNWSIYSGTTGTGSRLNTASNSGSLPNLAAALEIGRWPGGGNYFSGYIDEFRITRAARYSGATYTVPASQFPNA